MILPCVWPVASCRWSLGCLRQRVGRHHEDFDEALVGQLSQLETRLGPDFPARVRAGSAPERLNAERETSLDGRQRGDPAAVGHQLE